MGVNGFVGEEDGASKSLSPEVEGYDNQQGSLPSYGDDSPYTCILKA